MLSYLVITVFVQTTVYAMADFYGIQTKRESMDFLRSRDVKMYPEEIKTRTSETNAEVWLTNSVVLEKQLAAGFVHTSRSIDGRAHTFKTASQKQGFFRISFLHRTRRTCNRVSNPCNGRGSCQCTSPYSCSCHNPRYAGRTCNVDTCYPSEGADITFIVDSSNSQNEQLIERQLNYTKSVIQAFPIGDTSFRFSLITFSHVPTVRFSLNTHLSKENLSKAVDDVIVEERGTSNLHSAINIARTDIFGNISNTRVKYVIVLGDGLYSSPLDTSNERIHAINAGIRMMSVGFGVQVLQQGLIETALSYRYVFSPQTEDFKHWLLRNHAMDTCPECTTEYADVFVLFETSSDLSLSVFYLRLNTLKDRINKMPIGTNGVHVSYATFDSIVTQRFDFQTYQSPQSVNTNIFATTKLTNQTSNYTNALQHVKDDVFVSSNGYRQGARKIVVIFMSEIIPDLEETISEANDAKANDIIIVIVTASSKPKPNMTSLLEIVSDPAYLFIIDDTVYGAASALDSLATLFEYNLCQSTSF